MLQCRPAQEFSFGPRALKDALVSWTQTCSGSTRPPSPRPSGSSWPRPTAPRSLFCTLLIHTAFDWLLSRPEASEDFETFHVAQLARRPAPGWKHIYLQPMGKGLGHTPASQRAGGKPHRAGSWATTGRGVPRSQQGPAAGARA